MKRSGFFIVVILSVIFSLSFSIPQSSADERLYRMVGDITAIDLDYNTVVIEVPLEGKLFTVGGPLSHDAILKKGNLSVDLVDFMAGDRVTVEWKPIEQGHLILLLQAK